MGPCVRSQLGFAMHLLTAVAVSAYICCVSAVYLCNSYNDVSPLENRSIFVASRALRTPKCNFLKNLPSADRRRVRQVMCDVVLATDVTHKQREAVNEKLLNEVVEAGVDYTNESHRMTVLRTILTCADISSTTAAFPLFIRWGSRLFHEIRAFNPDLDAEGFAAMQDGFLEKVRAGTIAGIAISWPWQLIVAGGRLQLGHLSVWTNFALPADNWSPGFGQT